MRFSRRKRESKKKEMTTTNEWNRSLSCYATCYCSTKNESCHESEWVPVNTTNGTLVFLSKVTYCMNHQSKGVLPIRFRSLAMFLW
jgi:hypothetical protein